MRLPEDILRRSPEEAARRVALGYLRDARKAAKRLGDPQDAEALHAFRVAIRRLRSTLRAYGPELRAAIGKKQRRALRRLQAATGGGRDAEVLLAWLEPQRAGLRETDRVGHDWLVARLIERRAAAYRSVRVDVRRAFASVRNDLRERLERMTVEVHLLRAGPSPTFGEAAAQAASEHSEELVRALSRIGKIDDQEAIHEARIAGKRLRYLLEPLVGDAPGVEEVVTRCRELQGLLGDLHDMFVLAGEIRAGLGAAAAERAFRIHDLALADAEPAMRVEMERSEHPGLIELSRRVQARTERLFADLERSWLQGGAERFAAEVRALASELARGARPPVEIERKYLLSALPKEAARVEPLEIDQGYLPGEVLRERIRRTREGGVTTYERTVKLGRGIERTELSEEASAEVFEALWPLTQGCRVRKRRYRVAAGDHTWELDEFLDRPLFLAEVELGHADEEASPPAWLGPYVVREVTDDPAYVNLNLAR